MISSEAKIKVFCGKVLKEGLKRGRKSKTVCGLDSTIYDKICNIYHLDYPTAAYFFISPTDNRLCSFAATIESFDILYKFDEVIVIRVNVYCGQVPENLKQAYRESIAQSIFSDRRKSNIINIKSSEMA